LEIPAARLASNSRSGRHRGSGENSMKWLLRSALYAFAGLFSFICGVAGRPRYPLDIPFIGLYFAVVGCSAWIGWSRRKSNWWWLGWVLLGAAPFIAFALLVLILLVRRLFV
jgi:hypothetical protein